MTAPPPEDDPYRRIDEALGRRTDGLRDPWSSPDASHAAPPPPPAPPPVVATPTGPTVPTAAPSTAGPVAPPLAGPPPAAGSAPVAVTPSGRDAFAAPPTLPADHGAYAYGPPPVWAQAPGTEGLAVAALVLGILCLLCLPFFGPVGLGLGVVALSRIRVRGTQGRGMAIAGIVTGAIGTVITLLVVGVAVFSPESFS